MAHVSFELDLFWFVMGILSGHLLVLLLAWFRRLTFIGGRYNPTVRLRIRTDLHINLTRGTTLKDGWTHGDAADPNKWPWWKLFHFSFFKLPSVSKPSDGYRLWVYGRHKARNWDVYVDRRNLV